MEAPEGKLKLFFPSMPTILCANYCDNVLVSPEVLTGILGRVTRSVAYDE